MLHRCCFELHRCCARGFASASSHIPHAGLVESSFFVVHFGCPSGRFRGVASPARRRWAHPSGKHPGTIPPAELSVRGLLGPDERVSLDAACRAEEDVTTPHSDVASSRSRISKLPRLNSKRGELNGGRRAPAEPSPASLQPGTWQPEWEEEEEEEEAAETAELLGELNPRRKRVVQGGRKRALDDVGYELRDGFETRMERNGTDKAFAEAKQYSIKLLNSRPQSAEMLRKKLVNREYPPRVIEDVVSDMQRLGFQNDKEYAEIFARSRFASYHWGPYRIQRELKQKGIAPELIEAAIGDAMGKESVENILNAGQQLDDATANDSEPCSCPFPEQFGDASWKSLMDACRRKWKTGSGKELDGRKRRMLGWLQRRGYSWPVTNQIMKELLEADT